jgi:pimeloyl-ACP methyl ester carboxylesterase
MATIVHKGVKLVYDDQGAGEPASVFIHGWTCDRSFFAPQAEHFARQHRVISLDLRGHGESDKPQDAYPISAYVDDITHVIGELKLGKWWRSDTAWAASPSSSWAPPIPTRWRPS